MGSNARTSAETFPPDLIMIDEQVVACEVEIDTFDEVHYEDDQQEVVHVEEEYVQNNDEPGPSDYHYQYDGDVDSNGVYLFDADTEQIHHIDPTRHHLETSTEDEEIDIEEYIDEGGSPSAVSIASTSNRCSNPVMSYMAQKVPSASYTNSLGRNPLQRNSYYDKKQDAMPRLGRKPIFNPISFQTTYSQSISRRGKRVLKRTHIPITANDDIESMMDDSHVIRRLQDEITVLRKENEEMKKTYEAVHKRYDSVNMVLNEAKLKHKEAKEEKRKLQRQLTVARTTGTQLAKLMPPVTVPRYRYQ